MDYRIEKDTLGEVQVPADKLWGAQTERSRNNFKIGTPASMPKEIIYGFAYLKKGAAYANHELGVLSKEKRDYIAQVCDEILEGKLDNQFPLVIWQTGSGTQSNMNVNEVIANRALELIGRGRGDYAALHPIEHVNMSQSTNDVYPTSLRLATAWMLDQLVDEVDYLQKALKAKSVEFADILKMGRTQLQDAVPMTLGQEFGGYRHQLELGAQRVAAAAAATLLSRQKPMPRSRVA